MFIHTLSAPLTKKTNCQNVQANLTRKLQYIHDKCRISLNVQNVDFSVIWESVKILFCTCVSQAYIPS